jgi:hypothetical protein
MEDELLRVFSLQSAGFPLRTLLGAVRSAGHPAAVSTGIAGEATDEELDREDWNAVFLRWKEPELHDVALIERDMKSESDETRTCILAALRDAMNTDDPGGQLIVADHLRRTEAVYSVQVLPALVEQDDHAAWGALDIVLRCIAAQTDGLIAVPGEGYCDADGELLLAENELDEELRIGIEDEQDEELG